MKNIKVLCGLLLASAVLGSVGAANAMYKTQVVSSDSARVARFKVSADQTESRILLEGEGDQKKVPVNVTLDTEVAAEYDVIVKNVPQEILTTLESGLEPAETSKNEDGTVNHVFKTKEKLNPGTSQIQTAVVFTSLDGSAVKNNVQIQVAVRQIQ
ncbi:MAG: hypothetical protein HUJ55_04750 [Ileibacterium sp.]|nr:hypothetical protein [Ileibacterium sp.]